jgi:hypothetical protein
MPWCIAKSPTKFLRVCNTVHHKGRYHGALRARTNIFLDKRLPALRGQSHVLGIARHKHDAATLVERAQPDPIFDIQWLLAHRHNFLLPTVFLLFLFWGRDGVRSEPGAFLGYDCAVLGEEDEDEGVELSKIRSVRLVFVWCGPFVVDGCKKVV